MKITGNKSNIFIEFKGNTYIFDGEMVVGGFYATLSTFRKKEYLESSANDRKLRDEIVSEIIKETRDKDFKIFFE